MSLPNEKLRALNNAREFLLSLYDPKLRPKTIKELKSAVRSVSKHYPSEYDLELIASCKKCSRIIGKE